MLDAVWGVRMHPTRFQGTAEVNAVILRSARSGFWRLEFQTPFDTR
jgi:hypothetical protein